MQQLKHYPNCFILQQIQKNAITLQFPPISRVKINYKLHLHLSPLCFLSAWAHFSLSFPFIFIFFPPQVLVIFIGREEVEQRRGSMIKNCAMPTRLRHPLHWWKRSISSSHWTPLDRIDGASGGLGWIFAHQFGKQMFCVFWLCHMHVRVNGEEI